MALGFDPQQLPVLGIDDHLPAVRADELTSAALRQRFLAPPLWTPEIIKRGAASSTASRRTRRCSCRWSLRDEIDVLLTAAHRPPQRPPRPDQLPRRPRRARATPTRPRPRCARRRRRSAWRPTTSRCSARCPPTPPAPASSSRRSSRWCGRGSRCGPTRSRSPRCSRCRWRFLMNPAHHRRHAVRIRRRAARVPVDAVARASTPSGRPRRYFIWGATAAMLRNLYRFLAA